MKRLELSAVELQTMSPMQVDKFILDELLKAGFDMKKPIRKYMGAETYTYLFIQDEEK